MTGQLDARVVLRRGEFTLDVAVSVAPGEVLAVLGPNGAGKSTLLAAMAGLLVPDQGSITLGGRLLTGPGVLVPPERRRVGLMGQDPLLFPHLSALENIAFGLRSQGRGREAARRVAAGWLERMGLADFGSRRPSQLSGGQRQRVALARALAAEPELLMLDEPLGALDVETAPEIRQLLRTQLRGSDTGGSDTGGSDTGGSHAERSRTSTILVTHDVLDAAVLADRVLVLAGGSMVDSGGPAEVLSAPRSDFSAALAGLNLLTGPITAAAGRGGIASLSDAAGRQVAGVADEHMTAGETAAAVFAPAAVSVFPSPVTGSPRNHWPAVIGGMEPGPSAIRVRTAETPVIAADVTAASVADLNLHPGALVYLSVKATEVRIYRR